MISPAPPRTIFRLARGALRAAALLCLAALLALPALTLAGFQVSVVTTASMSPTLPIDTLTISRPVDARALVVGDVITYADRNDNLVMHRIVEVLDAGAATRFRTQGDANRSADRDLVHEKDVTGRLTTSVGHVGAIARSLAAPSGGFVLVGLLAPLGFWAWSARSRDHDLAPRLDLVPSWLDG